MGIAEKFQQAFNAPPQVCVRAPGRTNLIGEHIDYSGGHVMPIAIGCAVEIAASPRQDGRYRLRSAQLDEAYEGVKPARRMKRPFWANYPFGVLREFEELGHECRGLDALVDGNVPRASGLSSSAALEVAAAWAVQALLETSLSRMEIALLGQRAENRFVGVNCGIMDQAISANARAGHAMLLDCNSLEARHVPLDLRDEMAILVAHSGVRRGLSNSAYNQRRASCDAALEIVRAETGKDLACLCAATLDDLGASKEAMNDETFRRARHAITEEARVQEAATALLARDFGQMGRLLDASHASLRDDYEVSCPELDELTERIRGRPGALGSRLTGAGFGGCTVSLVEAGAADEIIADLKQGYYARRDLKPIVFVTEAEQGVQTL